MSEIAVDRMCLKVDAFMYPVYEYVPRFAVKEEKEPEFDYKKYLFQKKAEEAPKPVIEDEETLRLKRIRQLFNNVDPVQIMKVLEKPLSERSQEDKDLLRVGLKNNQFFKKVRNQISPNSYIQLFDQIVFKQLDQFNTVFEYGDKGNNFYIILDGEVCVFVPKNQKVAQKLLEQKEMKRDPSNFAESKSRKKTQENQVQEELPQLKFEHMGKQVIPKKNETTSSSSNLLMMESTTAPVDNNNNNATKDQYKNTREFQEDLDTVTISSHLQDMALVKVLKEGEGFGEIALRSDKHRTATLVCKKECKFISLSKQSFKQILDDHLNEELKLKTEFVKTLNIFKNIPFKTIINIIPFLKKRTYRQNEVVYAEKEDAKKLYFIINGQVEIGKRPPNILKNKRFVYQNNVSEPKTPDIFIAQKEGGDWFGEVEVLLKKNRYTSAKVISPIAVFYRIDKVKFLSNLQAPDFLDHLLNQALLQQKWIENYYDQATHKTQKVDPMKETFLHHQQGQLAMKAKLKEEFVQVPTYIYEGKLEGDQKSTAKSVYYTIIKNYQNKLQDLKSQILRQKFPSRYGKNSAFCENKLSRENSQRSVRSRHHLNTSINSQLEESQIMTNRGGGAASSAINRSHDEKLSSPRASVMMELNTKLAQQLSAQMLSNKHSPRMETVKPSPRVDSVSNKSTNVNSIHRKVTEANSSDNRHHQSSVQSAYASQMGLNSHNNSHVASTHVRNLSERSLMFDDQQIVKGSQVYDKMFSNYSKIKSPAQLKFQQEEEELRQKIITITNKNYKQSTDSNLKVMKSKSQNEMDLGKMKLFEKLNLHKVFSNYEQQAVEYESSKRSVQMLQLPRISNSSTTRNLNNIYFAERYFKSKQQQMSRQSQKNASQHQL